MLKRLDLANLAPDRRLVSWYVAFTRASSRRWWDTALGLEDGFTHCYAFRQVGDRWLYINPRTDFCDVALEAGGVHNGRHCFPVSSDGPVTILRVLAAVPKGQLRSRWFCGPVTCVETVKSLLGIRAFSVFTPRQLYDYMRACRGPIQKTETAATFRPGGGAGASLEARAG